MAANREGPANERCQDQGEQQDDEDSSGLAVRAMTAPPRSKSPCDRSWISSAPLPTSIAAGSQALRLKLIEDLAHELGKPVGLLRFLIGGSARRPGLAHLAIMAQTPLIAPPTRRVRSGSLKAAAAR
jgi:hypothetical protein